MFAYNFDPRHSPCPTCKLHICRNPLPIAIDLLGVSLYPLCPRISFCLWLGSRRQCYSLTTPSYIVLHGARHSNKKSGFTQEFRTQALVRPEKWGDPQVGFRGSNASGGRIVLLPGAFWAHCASKMAILGASLLLCILQCFRASEGMLPPGACRSSRASAKRIVSCKGLCASSLCPQIPHAPAPTFVTNGKSTQRKSA